MAYAITQTCCNDASCVSVCPVNCIHPTPDEPDFGTTEMLYVDPQTCIDCGACADACPVDAVFPVDRTTGPDSRYAELNKQYFEARPADNSWAQPHFPRSVPHEAGTLRIAVVGTGPAAGYTAQSLLRAAGAEVTLIDRLPVPGGLIRHGVAPDHQPTKRIADTFAGLYRHPRLRMHLNVEVGKDLTHAELAAHHHAVVYAVGAASDRTLDIPGEDTAGSIAASTFVGWYNADPTVPATAVDLSAERAVVVGNGNVALDVARILVADPEELARTDIADHALDALRTSRVREVVLLGRRGPGQAAYTRPEFLALCHLRGVTVVVDDRPGVRDAIAAADPSSKAALLDGIAIEQADLTSPPAEGKRIVLRFFSSATELTGEGRVESVRVAHNTVTDRDGTPYAERTAEQDTISAALVVRSAGYRGAPVAGLPFDPVTATVPNRAGRVTDTGSDSPWPATYVVGWAKRGPSGGIGTNRTCAAETVGALMDDAAAGLLPEPSGTRRDFTRLVRRRQPQAVGLREVLAVDRAERANGVASGRPRVKFATFAELRTAGKRFGRAGSA
ncbi:FAD-dependent oxidoreductase [Streptomyces sp. SID10853]|uniref:FAD-dependent oxidoreductase n=1 Tax=Streptomyces sp. SID10853 TaxID=2706028 RepID=UPI0013C16121|nr:FAD-dependent oxidoreductase [Streptomyces sp. SID10853]NDZ81363.1 FAD-dependent oxidoreductase [Streptomyces sp. SID10853]